MDPSAPVKAAEPAEGGAEAQEDDGAAAEAKKPSARGTDESARAHLATDPDWCRQVCKGFLSVQITSAQHGCLKV